MEGQDFVIVGQQPWDTEIGSNCKNIAIEISKTNRVLYINSPLDRITLYRDKKNPKTKLRLDVIKGKANGLIEVQDNLWNLYPDCMVESINWIPVTAIFNLINHFNNKKLSQSILKAIKKLGFKNFILFNDNEMFKGYFLNDFLKPKASVYYSRDYMIGVDYWKKHGEIIEPKLIAKNTLCVANSTFLADYCRKYNPNSFYIGQGCDLEIFFRKKIQLEILGLESIKRPIIGYVGALQSIRLDKDIIAHIALTKPEWTIVLVGQEDDIFKASELHDFNNIIFTGNKPINILPDFINAFDVCINPQLVNMVTIGNYPRKIDEYLAIGKPVVATATKAMETFSDFVYLAENKQQYVTMIEQALDENSDQLEDNRRNFALKHTWENSVKDLYNAIEHTLSDNT